MSCHLSCRISVLALLTLSVGTVNQPAAAADHGLTSFGAYALAAKTSARAKEVIEYEHGYVAKDMIIPAWGVNEGLRIFAYYPDSKKIRMSALGTYWATNATYYRPDHTREVVLSVSNSVTEAYWYDKNGAKLLIKQVWFKSEDVEGASAWQSPVKHHYKLWSSTKMDIHGKPQAEYGLSLNKQSLDILTQYNVAKVGDSLTTLFGEDGTLQWTNYRPDEKHFGARADHVGTEAIPAPKVPSELTRLPPHIDEDDFPELPIVNSH